MGQTSIPTSWRGPAPACNCVGLRLAGPQEESQARGPNQHRDPPQTRGRGAKKIEAKNHRRARLRRAGRLPAGGIHRPGHRDRRWGLLGGSPSLIGHDGGGESLLGDGRVCLHDVILPCETWEEDIPAQRPAQPTRLSRGLTGWLGVPSLPDPDPGPGRSAPRPQPPGFWVNQRNHNKLPAVTAHLSCILHRQQQFPQRVVWELCALHHHGG